MAVQVNLAPFINLEFKVTGAWGEPRSEHIHAGVDLQTSEAYSSGIGQDVFSMSRGIVKIVDKDGSTGSGYRTLCRYIQ